MHNPYAYCWVSPEAAMLRAERRGKRRAMRWLRAACYYLGYGALLLLVAFAGWILLFAFGSTL